MTKKYLPIIYIISFLILLQIIFPYLIPSLLLPIFNLNKNKNAEVVIAHYKEDLSWVDKYIPKNYKVYIYTKSDEKPNCKRNYIHKYLKNVGRCDHTYLYHIYSNYDRNNFSSNIIFLPGSADLYYPFPKISHLLLILNNISNFDFYCPNINLNFYPFYTNFILKYISEKGYTSAHKNNRHKDSNLKKYKFNNFKEWTNYFNLKEIKYISYQGLFSIKSKVIFKRTKSFYLDLINHVNYDDNTLNGHFLERSWYTIFNPN